MRKITRESSRAFVQHSNFKKDNTEIQIDNEENIARLILHGNEIARIVSNRLYITDADWKTNVTKERLNGVLSAEGYSDSICQRKGVWYLGDKEMPSNTWIEVSSFID